jgi:4a-hydroxytetrahydrobiopterin dehydratase
MPGSRPEHGPLNARMAVVISDLVTKACVPCRDGVPPLKGAELATLEKQVDRWNVIEEHHLAKTFRFPDFREALKFVNRVGELAEEQGHLPCLGKSRDHDLDAQDQRLDGERFHSGRKNRPAPQTIVFSPPQRQFHFECAITRRRESLMLARSDPHC